MTDSNEELSIQHQQNAIGLTRLDYKGASSTLCKGCGHNSIANQIITACYEMNIEPGRSSSLVVLGAPVKARLIFWVIFWF